MMTDIKEIEPKLTNLGTEKDEIFVPAGFENIIINTAKTAYKGLEKYMSIKSVEFTPWQELEDADQKHYIGRAAYFFAYPEAEIEAPHEAWKLRMQLSGFEYGLDTKNQKQHPHIMPFAKLPEELQVADAIFKGVVSGILESD